MQLGGGLDLGRHARLRLNSWAAAPRPGGLPLCAGSPRIPMAWGELRTPAAGHRADSHSSSWTSRSAFNWQTASRSGSDEGQARPAGQLAGHFAPDSDHASRPPPGDQAPGQRWRAVSRTPAGGRCCSRDTVRRAALTRGEHRVWRPGQPRRWLSWRRWRLGPAPGCPAQLRYLPVRPECGSGWYSRGKRSTGPGGPDAAGHDADLRLDRSWTGLSSLRARQRRVRPARRPRACRSWRPV